MKLFSILGFLVAMPIWGQQPHPVEFKANRASLLQFIIPNPSGSLRLVSNPEVAAMAQGVGCRILFTTHGPVVEQVVKRPDAHAKTSLNWEPDEFDTTRIHEVFQARFLTRENQKKHIYPELSQPLATPVHYFKGSERVTIQAYGELSYEQVWAGISLTCRPTPGSLALQWSLAPGAEPEDIGFDMSVPITVRGKQMVLGMDSEGMLLDTPKAFQIREAGFFPVPVTYRVNNGKVGFSLETYDPTLKVEIVSNLIWSSFLGGTGEEGAIHLALDEQDQVYAAGYTLSGDFPQASKAFNLKGLGLSEVFVAKFSQDGSQLEYVAILGGSDDENFSAIQVDTNHQVTVTGITFSTDFPTTPGAYDENYNGQGDVFVTQLNAAGNDLIFSTFLGGQDAEFGHELAFDSSGNVLVVGYTSSADFPTTPGAHDQTYNGSGDNDGFITKLNSTGTGLVFSTYLGGSNTDVIKGITVAPNNNFFVVGTTLSTDLPTTPGSFSETLNGARDLFVAKLNAVGSSLTYCTYIGGSGLEFGFGIANRSGNAYITGQTDSSDFPVTGSAYDQTNNSSGDGVVCKISGSGATLLFSTFLGGSGGDIPNSIDLDDEGNCFIIGETNSADFPTTPNAFQTTNQGGLDMFVSLLDATGSQLRYSTFLGGTAADSGTDLVTDHKGMVFLAGSTQSSDFPVTGGAFQQNYQGNNDAVVCQFPICPFYQAALPQWLNTVADVTCDDRNGDGVVTILDFALRAF